MDDYPGVLPADWQERYEEFLGRPLVRDAIASDCADAFFKEYPRVMNGPPPFIDDPPPVKRSRVALVSTAGIHLPGMAPFRSQGLLGDTGMRRLALQPLGDFWISHGHYDEGPVRSDQNVLWPAERLQELVGAGEIGSLAQHGYSIDGYCTDAMGLIRLAGEGIWRGMRSEGVEIALLVPV